MPGTRGPSPAPFFAGKRRGARYDPPMTSVLFVCTANICRSPMAETVFRARVPGLAALASAGVRASSRPQAMDMRAKAALERRNYQPDTRWRSRRVEDGDFERFDLLLAMDERVLEELRRLSPAEHEPKIRLLLDGVPGFDGREVPDPYFGSPQGFENVLNLIEQAALAWPRQAVPQL